MDGLTVNTQIISGRKVPSKPFPVTFDDSLVLNASVYGKSIVRPLSSRILTTILPSNTPAEPQYLRASAYLPPTFVASHPGSHPAIARIAQTFIEAVGVPTVQQWRHNALLRGWPLTQQGVGASPNPTSNVLVPQPQHNSAHYFFGRPLGALDAILASAPAPPGPVVVIGDDDEFDDMAMNAMDAIERAGYAEAAAAERLQHIHDLEEQVAILTGRVAEVEEQNAELQAQLTARRITLPARSTPPTTPPVNPRSSPANPRSPYAGPSSINPRSPLAVPFHEDEEPDDLDIFISNKSLEELALAIKLVIRAVVPVKWYEEFMMMGIPAPVVSRLVDVAAAL
ncbi:hypothetical protein B0H14DRAFT_3560891 [Mycena olivaceomarginata]|nr:hypothetical protein B0H14DRAFT_3560891 [Mycena olivaceomarginata]